MTASRPRARHLHRLRGDDGTVIPMIIGFLLVVSLLLLVVIDATVLFLRNRSLSTFADGAALAAAQAIDKAAVYAGGNIKQGANLPVGATANAAADDYLRSSGFYAENPTARGTVQVDPDTNAVTVTLTLDRVQLPFTHFVDTAGVHLTSHATAILRCGGEGQPVGCR